MNRQHIQISFGLLALIATCLAVAADSAISISTGLADPEDHSEHEVPLTPEQIRALVQRVLENQLYNDRMLAQYERTEHEVVRRGDKEGIEKETICRVVPTGGSVARVEIVRNGKPADSAYLERQWRGVAQALLAESRATGSRAKDGQEWSARRKRERGEMVDAIAAAFLFHWAGRLTEGHRTFVELTFEPNPAFKSSARFAPLYAHTRGTVWIDESGAQLARVAAELTDDISWGAGLIAKLYKGGHFTFQQQEVEPGIWLPSGYSYDFDGRKFLFSLSAHERVDFSNYHRLGPPEEALGWIRREHPGVPVSDP
jgi:hypothetical protein